MTEATEFRALKDPRAVFVVHGRNNAARDAMFTFLRALDLKPIEWNRAVELTGNGSPYIGQVLDAAFDHAQAVVVLMTPDEVAYLQPRYGNGDNDPDTQAAPQARPNVLFEAGMALGRDPSRTVLVELGAVRPFSDVAGRHAIRLSNDPGTRRALAKRLETAGCPVDTTGNDWLTIGDFTAPPPPGDGLPLGRRLPSAGVTRPAIDIDINYGRRGGARLSTLKVINRGTETAYDVALAIPQDASLALTGSPKIARIPGEGRSVTLDVLDHQWGGNDKDVFDITVTARTESGEEVTKDIFIDLNG